jgi:pimeloyl-ACP methyl ester carboxylesterase
MVQQSGQTNRFHRRGFVRAAALGATAAGTLATRVAHGQEATPEAPGGSRVEPGPAAAETTHHVAQVNGIAIHYRRAGSGDPLVLLHGWPQHSLMWHRVMPVLAERYTVIAPDLRGAGGSAITPGGYDKRTMAEDVWQLVQSLGLGPIFLVGYDLGAGVAYQYASAHPDGVRRFAFMEFGLPGFGYEQGMMPSPDWTNGSNWHLSFFTLPDIAERFLAGQERELLAWFFWHLSCNPEAVSGEDFEAYVREISKPGALRAGIQYYAAVWVDAEDNKASARTPLAMPVLGVGGECSAGPFMAQILEPVATEVRPVVIPGAGHWLGDENPAALADALLAFFGEEGSA